jgi:hypothetical protein
LVILTRKTWKIKRTIQLFFTLTSDFYRHEANL